MARPESDSWRSVPCIIGSTRCKRGTWIKILGDPGILWFLHLCDNELCWEPTHIYLGTASDNTQDAFAACTRLRTLTPEVRAKISAALKGRKPSEEHRAKLSAVLTGQSVSEEARARMSAAAKKRQRFPVPQATRAKIAAALVGKKRPAEVGAKVSAALRGRSIGPMSEEHRAKISATKRRLAEERRQDGLAGANPE